MGTLREQMEGDLVVRGMSERTREAYVGAVAKLAKHYGRSPDRITEQEVQGYLADPRAQARLVELQHRGPGDSVFLPCDAQAAADAVRGSAGSSAAEAAADPLARGSRDALIERTVNVKHRAILMTAYGAGLRLTEICHLKVSDVDSKRMTIRVEQGKGAKDRYTLLSPTLLRELRRYWCVYRPKLWLSAPAIRLGPSANTRFTGSITRPSGAPASPSPAACIRYVTRSPPICWRAERTSIPFSG